MLKDLLTLFVKGIAVGGSMTIPGCSGGTMAIILGIYDRLIHAVSSFTKDLKKNLMVLLPFLLGSIMGILLLLKPLKYLLDNYKTTTMFFFLGAILGSLPALVKKSGVKKNDWFRAIVYPLIGFGIVLLLGLLPKGAQIQYVTSFTDFLLLLLSGIIIAVALVLPGISTSHMLLLLGMYDVTIDAIEQFNFSYLIPLGISVLAGTFLTTRTLEKALNKYHTESYLLIIGFVIGSVIQIFEETPLPAGMGILYSAITLIAGFYAIMTVSKYSLD